MAADHVKSTARAEHCAGLGLTQVALSQGNHAEAESFAEECLSLGNEGPARHISLVWSSERELPAIASAYVELSRKLCPRLVEAEQRRVQPDATTSPVAPARF